MKRMLVMRVLLALIYRSLSMPAINMPLLRRIRTRLFAELGTSVA